MGLRAELTNRWGLLLGAATGGIAWAITLPVYEAVAIGVGVWLLRAGFSSMRPRAVSAAAPLGALESSWLARAARAAENFAAAGAELPAGPSASQVSALRGQVDETVATLRGLAEKSTLTAKALTRVDERTLRSEQDRLTAARGVATGEVAAELDRSLASVRTQLEVCARITSARKKLLAQLESGAIGLESLVARVAELSTTSITALPAGGSAIDGIADDLEGIRRGIAETAQIVGDIGND